ncbi:PREDICTED: protein KNATM [Tarenaya hassleriana]|uniref:protein KNATM n=1 Tax=Tarenaya hassleriana TaxID=28532 RepID=UPI00053C6860|nr:PREDICTED: protein KNATM [Tarenaya hassleriana]
MKTMEDKKDGKNPLKFVTKELQNTQEEEEEMELLQQRISSHPLYGLLLEAHFNCLKVCSGEESPEMETEYAITLLDNLTLRPDSSPETSPELDRFMGAYCTILRELKEAMEKQLRETERFVDSMYSQLNDSSP